MRHPFVNLVFVCFLFVCCDNTPDRASVNDPISWLKMTENQVIQAKGGEVEKGFSNDKDGTLLAHLAYEEPWFDLASNTAYLIDDRDKNVVQINLTLEGGQKQREHIIASVSNYIGEPEAQGVAGNNAPSRYFAYWQRVGYTGVYQEYSDRTEIYFIPVNDELDKALPTASPANDSTADDVTDSITSK